MFTTDGLAQEIRRVDGNHDLGAYALAEALEDYITDLLNEKYLDGWHDSQDEYGNGITYPSS